MRLAPSFAALALALSLVGCGTEVGDVYGIDTPLGATVDSNLKRIALFSSHEVLGTVGRTTGAITPPWSDPVDALSSRDPEIVLVERLSATRFRVTGLREGETVLRLEGDGDERYVPIRVMPAGWIAPSGASGVP